MIRKSKRRPRASDLDRAIGARLRQHRLLKNYSQQQLGNALGVSFQAVQKYETGENCLSGGRLQQAARFLGVPLSELVADDALPPLPPDTASYQALVIAGKLQRLPEHQRLAINRVIDTLAAAAP